LTVGDDQDLVGRRDPCERPTASCGRPTETGPRAGRISVGGYLARLEAEVGALPANRRHELRRGDQASPPKAAIDHVDVGESL